MKKFNNKEIAKEVKVRADQMCGPSTNCSCTCRKCSDSQERPTEVLKQIYKA